MPGEHNAPTKSRKSPVPQWTSYKKKVAESFHKSSTARIPDVLGSGVLSSGDEGKELPAGIKRACWRASEGWKRAKVYSHQLKHERCTPWNCCCKWGYSCFRIWTSPQYWCDWFVLILLGVAVMLMSQFWKPYDRRFFEDDNDISYPFEKDPSIGDGTLFAVTIGIAIPVFFVVQCWTRSMKDFHRATLGVIQAFLITLFFGYIIKNSAGKLRPHFLDVCKPTFPCPAIGCSDTDCTGSDDAEIDEARRAFPSLHSGGSMATFGFLTFYLIGKIQPFGPHRYFWKMVVAFSPIFSAALVSITRYKEYHHDAYDIAAGMLLGLVFAFLSYHQHYPSIFVATNHPVLPLKRRKYEQHLPIFNPRMREYRLKNIQKRMRRNQKLKDKELEDFAAKDMRIRALHVVPGLAETLAIPLSDISEEESTFENSGRQQGSSRFIRCDSEHDYESSSEGGKVGDIESGRMESDSAAAKIRQRKKDKHSEAKKRKEKSGEKKRQTVVVFSSPHSSDESSE